MSKNTISFISIIIGLTFFSTSSQAGVDAEKLGTDKSEVGVIAYSIRD